MPKKGTAARAKMVEYKGEIYTFSRLARKYGINRSTLRNRLMSGMSLEEALTEKPKNIGNHNKQKKEGITAQDRKRCEKCFYNYGRLYGGDIGCRYILKENHSRPCSAHNCKVFKPLKGRRPPEQMTVVPRREELWI